MRQPSGLLPHAPVAARPPARPAGPADYLELYGLSKPPFGAPSEAVNYVLFDSHRRTFELLIDHMVNGKGLLVLYGESGSGRTEMLRAAGKVARDSNVRTIQVERPINGRVDLTQLVSALLSQSDPDLPAADTIETVLRPPHKAVLLDDLDLLPPDCLQLLGRLLQQSAEPGNVAIVASSIADAAVNLDRTELIEIARMARTSVRLPGVEPAEARQYIERSLWVAGGTIRRLITPDALRLVIDRSRGLPGGINREMETAFIAGFARGDARITAKTLGGTGVAPGQRFSAAPLRRNVLPPWLVPGLATGLLTVGAAAFLYRALNGQEEPLPAMPPAVASIQRPALTPASPTTVPPPQEPAQAAKPAETLAPDVMAAVMRRGQQSLSLSDIAAARLLFRHAAEAGNPRAAVAMGKTYDPDYLTSGAALGEKPDPVRAAEWYRKALALGDAQAADLLKRLETRPPVSDH
jgi:type II secretory pathway predicted ATPase ExeA